MTDLIGKELSLAKAYLDSNNIDYYVVRTSSPKPLENADSTRIIRQRLRNNRLELIVSNFKTEV